jgi:glycosyltransferase involved in cell wall biosynthesis
MKTDSKTPLHIIEFCTDFPLTGGIQTHVIDLSVWLRGRGHKITFAGETGASVSDAHCDDHLPLPMWQVTDFGKKGRISRVVALVKSAWALRRYVRRVGADIVHAHETAPAIVARLATLGLGVPVMMTFHGSAPNRVAGAAKVARWCTDLTVSPSKISLNALIAAGLPAVRAKVLGLGIRPLPDESASEGAALRADYLPGGKGALIFSASRLDPQKGIDVMIDVAKRVVARHPDTLFVVGGGGPLADEVEGWAEAGGVAQNMRFLGPIKTVPQHLHACDIYLLTSRWEALPISIVEAFRAGAPVVATDCGGVSELVDESVGALCAVEDAAGIADVLNRLIEDQVLRQGKGRAALARSAESRFDGGAVHASFEATYRALVAR